MMNRSELLILFEVNAKRDRFMDFDEFTKKTAELDDTFELLEKK